MSGYLNSSFVLSVGLVIERQLLVNLRSVEIQSCTLAFFLAAVGFRQRASQAPFKSDSVTLPRKEKERESGRERDRITTGFCILSQFTRTVRGRERTEDKQETARLGGVSPPAEEASVSDLCRR